MHPSAANHRDNETTALRGRRWVLSALALAILAGSAFYGATSTQAQTPAPAVKLYIFDLGQLKSANPQPLLDHGVTVEGTTIVRATVKKTLTGQLAEIGYKPADVTYLALSHYHYDHSANANAFAGSTWLVQRPERAAMFPETPPANPIDPNVTAKFSALKTSKTMLLDGDHDVFGDGSVVILSTPGHTPGHQSLFVRLAKSGPLVLSGDLYHYPSERTLKDFLPFGGRGNDAQEAASKAKVEALLKDKGATLWIQHDIVADAKLKKSPAFYD